MFEQDDIILCDISVIVRPTIYTDRQTSRSSYQSINQSIYLINQLSLDNLYLPCCTIVIQTYFQ